MITVSVQEAEHHFADVLRRVIAGEEVIIASENRDIAMISPIKKPSKTRMPGRAKGRVWISPDFDEPLPEHVTR